MKNSLILITVYLLLCTGLFAQPSTDIVLFDISYTNDQLSLGEPNWLTKRTGYDNQPHFAPNGKHLYYTSINESGQADIYRYDLAKKTTNRFTLTDNTSEYSPTVMPNGKHISVIMVEADGQTQRLWKFPLNGRKPKLIMDRIQPVGYHSWLNKKELAMFILGDPPTLQWVNIKKQSPKNLADKIGRSIHKVPGKDMISFVEKKNENDWQINLYDIQANSKSLLAKCLKGSEDFCWGSEDFILMGQGESLFIYKAWNKGEWKLVKDLNLGAISRLAVNREGTKLAIVVTR